MNTYRLPLTLKIRGNNKICLHDLFFIFLDILWWPSGQWDTSGSSWSWRWSRSGCRTGLEAYHSFHWRTTLKRHLSKKRSLPLRCVSLHRSTQLSTPQMCCQKNIFKIFFFYFNYCCNFNLWFKVILHFFLLHNQFPVWSVNVCRVHKEASGITASIKTLSYILYRHCFFEILWVCIKVCVLFEK